MSCASTTDIANSIWKDLGEPTDISVSYIQSKLTSNVFLGKLNTLLGVCHTIVNGDISPPLDIDEQAIYAALYMVDFYTRKINQLVNGLAGPILSLTEGDSRIVFVSIADQIRVLQNMLKELNLQLDKLATTYRVDKTIPLDAKYYNFDNGYNQGYISSG